MTASHSTSSGEAKLQVPSLGHVPERARQRQRQAPPKLTRRRQLAWQVGGVAAIAAFAVAASMIMSHGSNVLLATSFPQGEQLITNERAYFDPHAPGARVSQDWMVTSGSLFSYNGVGWTGIPDDASPNAASSNGTDSAVFRAITRRADFSNVTVSFQLRIAELVHTRRTPPIAYDGVHVFLRYQNARALYAVSVYRRDGIVAVKEKLPGGTSNGGTYYTLAEKPYRIPLHTWVPISVTIVTLSRGDTVRVGLSINNHQVLTTTESGSRLAPILAAGRVGLRGDNCDFFFRDFTVSPAAS